MTFDVDLKIQELKEKLAKVKDEHQNNEMWQTQPKWLQLFREFYFESQLEQLEAIKNRKFHVNIKIEIHCETFGTKEFPLVEFDLTDDDTVKLAIQNYEKTKTNSFFDE